MSRHCICLTPAFFIIFSSQFVIFIQDVVVSAGCVSSISSKFESMLVFVLFFTLQHEICAFMSRNHALQLYSFLIQTVLEIPL